MSDPLHLGAGRTLPRDEIAVECARSSGPGGQHVNKTETKVILRWSPGASPSLTEFARQRIAERLAARINNAGELVLHCDEYRSRRRNLEGAFDRLEALLKEALRPVRARKATRPTQASKVRRKQAKRRQAERKQGRRKPGLDD
jgi:ribosome-associated protein